MKYMLCASKQCRGTVLATSSGDTTVKLWDFSRGQSSLTLQDHTQCVWACAFHDQGEHLVSCSMDQTSKLWDIRTLVNWNQARYLTKQNLAVNAGRHSEVILSQSTMYASSHLQVHFSLVRVIKLSHCGI